MSFPLPVARVRKLILLLGDVAVLFASLFLTLSLRYGFSEIGEAWELHRVPFSLLFAAWIATFYIGGLYGLDKPKNIRSFVGLFFSIFAVDAGIAVFFFYFIPDLFITPKVVMFLDLGITAIALFSWRLVFQRTVVLPPQKVAVLGSGSEVSELLEDFKKHPGKGFACVLHVADQSQIHALSDKLTHAGVEIVVVAFDYSASSALEKELFDCIPLHIRFFALVDFYEQYFERVPLAVIDRTWFLENLNEAEKEFFSRLKRFVDIIAAVFLGIVGLILLPFLVGGILLSLGRPILFRQIRVGQFGKHFSMIKFRTYGREGDEQSIHPLGEFLRRSHLDEIPQLWNILKGDMSFVGPRPEQVPIVADLTREIPFYTERLLVAPGLTGWAQLHAPRARAEDALQKLQYDLFYIKHRTLAFDLQIMLKTMRILLG